MQLINWFISLFKKEKPYVCGGEFSIEIFDGKHRSVIWYRQPTSEEILKYAHVVVESDKSDLRKLNSESITAYTLQKMIRERKFLPFGKKIITKWKGYVDKYGKTIKDLDLIEKYKANHIDAVVIKAFEVNDKIKKKD